jgi:ABC-type dipeptide/oligopeptide/nickel transport system permease component
LLYYTIKRFLYFIPTIVIIVCMINALVRLVPGDPSDKILGDYATKEQREQLKNQLGLGQSYFKQTYSYLKNILQGNLGKSIIHNREVSDLISERWFATFELALFSLFCAFILGVSTGTLTITSQNVVVKFLLSNTPLLGVAIPNFWLGSILIWLLSIQANILPVSGRGEWQTYILPCCTLGFSLSAIISRFTSDNVKANLKSPHVKTAYAKGVPYFIIMGKHVLMNSAIPIITILSLQFGALLSGTIVTERIFDWPGLGSLILEALHNRDYPLINGCILLFSTTYLVVNIITDIIYNYIDPRLRFEQKP